MSKAQSLQLKSDLKGSPADSKEAKKIMKENEAATEILKKDHKLEMLG